MNKKLSFEDASNGSNAFPFKCSDSKSTFYRILFPLALFCLVGLISLKPFPPIFSSSLFLCMECSLPLQDSPSTHTRTHTVVQSNMTI